MGAAACILVDLILLSLFLLYEAMFLESKMYLQHGKGEEGVEEDSEREEEIPHYA